MYRLEAFTNSGMTALAASSVTTSVNVSTLTLSGLTAGTTYWLRVASVNHNDIAIYSTLGSTRTIAGAAPTAVAIAEVFVSSVSVTWTAVPSDNGYVLQAATDAGFTTVVASSVTADGAVTGLLVTALNPNTTYFVRVGSLWNGTTNYAASVPASTSTLTAPITGAQIYAVGSTSITVNWNALGSAAGYRLEAYSDGAMTILSVSSQTTGVAPSTLTVSGLVAGTTYWLRVGGINHNGLIGYTNVGSTRTIAGNAPTGVSFTGVFVTSVTVAWTAVPSDDGYLLEAATDILNRQHDVLRPRRQPLERSDRLCRERAVEHLDAHRACDGRADL
jgi:hypothetical protein